MALDINTLRKEKMGAEYISDVRICLTEDGQLVDQDDPRAVRLLVGAGSAIPVSVAAGYGLIREAGNPAEEAGRPTPAMDAEEIAEIEALTARLNAANEGAEKAAGEMEALTAENESLKSERDAANEGAANAGEQLNEALVEVKDLSEKLSAASTAIAELEATIANLQAAGATPAAGVSWETAARRRGRTIESGGPRE